MTTSNDKLTHAEAGRQVLADHKALTGRGPFPPPPPGEPPTEQDVEDFLEGPMMSALDDLRKAFAPGGDRQAVRDWVDRHVDDPENLADALWLWIGNEHYGLRASLADRGIDADDVKAKAVSDD